MMSGHGTIETAVGKATKLGAFDFIEKKPLLLIKLLSWYNNALNIIRLEEENVLLKQEKSSIQYG